MMDQSILTAWEQADLQAEAIHAQPEQVVRVRPGVDPLTITGAVLPGGGDTSELQQPTINVGKLPTWTIRVPVTTDILRGDMLLTLTKTYFAVDIPRLVSTYEIFLDIAAISLSYLPWQTQSWLHAFVPGEPGTTYCPCFDQGGRRVTDPSDPRCFGRGVLGGYASAQAVPLYLATGASTIMQTPDGYLETQPLPGLAIVMQPTPPMQRDDLLLVTPDPLAASGNPDRRYTLGDEVAPLQVFGIVIAKRYQVHALELGAVAYRVPVANTTPASTALWGTLSGATAYLGHVPSPAGASTGLAGFPE